MPVRAGRSCTRPGCAGVIRDGVCSVCGPRHLAADQAHDARRGTAVQRGYGRRWRRLRELVLACRPLCEACQLQGRTTLATDVHHRLAKREGGEDTPANLEPLCHACHSRITAMGG